MFYQKNNRDALPEIYLMFYQRNNRDEFAEIYARYFFIEEDVILIRCKAYKQKIQINYQFFPKLNNSHPKNDANG